MPYKTLQRSSTSCKQGFTLVELSVVLVIVALLAASVLVGRDLIRAAQVRATITQYEEFSSAVSAFRTKYQCLPGDCKNATDYGFDSQTNGNGDTFVGSSHGGTCGYQTGGCGYYNGVWKEYTNFWYHLYAAGLLKHSTPPYRDDASARVKYMVTGVATPPVAMPPAFRFHIPAGEYNTGHQTGGWSVQPDIGFHQPNGSIFIPEPHYFLIGFLLTFVQPYSYMSYAPADLYAIDVKIDDGLPATGKARAGTGEIEQPGPNRAVFSLNHGAAGANSHYCVSSGSPLQYNVAYSGAAGITSFPNGMCTLAIRGTF